MSTVSKLLSRGPFANMMNTAVGVLVFILAFPIMIKLVFINVWTLLGCLVALLIGYQLLGYFLETKKMERELQLVAAKNPNDK